MIAEAFSSVEFPILPIVKQHEETGIELIHRNPMLFTPRDFDYSPFFEIIKYPFIELSDLTTYRSLPWNRTGLISPDGQRIVQNTRTSQSKKTIKAPEESKESEERVEREEREEREEKAETKVTARNLSPENTHQENIDTKLPENPTSLRNKKPTSIKKDALS